MFETPLAVALKLIEMAEIEDDDIVLAPCRGDGVIYNNLPDYCQKDWVEILDGCNFFDYNAPVDIIVSNPPFSLYTNWLIHCIELNPRKLVLIMGCLNLTTKRLQLLDANGYYLTKMSIVNVKNWFGNTYLIIFEKGGTPLIGYDVARY